MYEIQNIDNMKYISDRKFKLIYNDYIYQNLDLSWVDKFWSYLDEDSIFICQTDDSSMAQIKMKLDSMPNSIFLNTAIVVQEWGGTSKRFFPRKHDYIFIYANGKNYNFYLDKIQIPKVTAGTKFDKKGTGLKTPCDVFYDLGNFSTMAKERVKDETGRNIRWQKSLKLMHRIVSPFVDSGGWILDTFMGSGSLGEYCLNNDLNYVGLEYDETVFNIAKNRLEELTK